MAEHETATEFGTKLVLDDHASEALEKIKGNFESIGEKVKEVEHEVAGFAKQAIAVAAGFQLDRGVESLKEFVGEAFNAARAEVNQVSALQGILAMSDRAGRSFTELGAEARELQEGLTGMGVELGVPIGVIDDMFEMVSARSKKSVEEIKGLVGQFALAGRAVPGGAEAIASAYRDLETGIVRPRNAIVALMRQTGVAAGSTRDIAKGMAQLMEKDPSKAFELADAAIGRMAAKTKNLPLSLDATIASLKNIREGLMETLGGPMLRALVGPLRELRQYLIANKEKFGEMAEQLGEKMGTWIKEAARSIQQGFEYLKNHATEIRDAIVAGVKVAREVVEFILAHKEEIAIAYGVKAAAPVVSGAVGLVKGGIALAPAAGQAAQMGMGGLGLAGAGGAMAGVAGSVAALSVAIAGLATVVWAATTIHTAASEFVDANAEADREALLRSAKEGNANREELERWRAELVHAHPEVAQLASHLVDLATAARKAREDQASDVRGAVSKLGDAAGTDESVQMFHDVFARMSAAHNEEQTKFLAGFLAKHGAILDAMHKAHVDLTDVGGDLAKAFEAVGDHMRAVEIGGIVDEQKKAAERGQLPKGLTYNFNGGQTFKITQDFRDADPDRVALIFRRDILKAASARTQSRLVGPFGL